MRLSEVSAPRQAFVRRCQTIGFGTITMLLIRDCQPVFSQETGVLLDLKLDGDDPRRPERQLTDFVLSTEIVRLFSMLDAMHDGIIEHIEIRTGIPRRIIVKASELNHK